MLLFKTVEPLQKWLQSQGQSIGFAPTMGALHQGHLELVRMAKNAGDLAVVSIFVNPTQFNDPADLEKYPRTPGRDLELLISAGCDVVFMPEVAAVYPPGLETRLKLDFGALTTVMEGVFRPGHFDGMATVVNRLLEIVHPSRLYMGQKDFQQLSIVRDMLIQLNTPIELVMCPTVRESDGLAMSSRNVRLSPEMRQTAPVIYQTLETAKTRLEAGALTADVENMALKALNTAGLRTEYFEVVDGESLLPVASFQAADKVVICMAAWAGEVRLIDNIIVKWQ